MKHKISVFVFVLSVLKVVVSQDECYENQALTTVVNPCNSCGIRSWCPEESEPECDCDPGYLKNSLGDCVLPEECDSSPPIRDDYETPPKQCGPNEVLHSCGSACPPTCENIRPTGVCTTQCVPGCFCKMGLVRRGKRCIPPSQCPGKPPERPPGGITPRRRYYGPYAPPVYRPPIYRPPPPYRPPRPPPSPPPTTPPPTTSPPTTSPPTTLPPTTLPPTTIPPTTLPPTTLPPTTLPPTTLPPTTQPPPTTTPPSPPVDDFPTPSPYDMGCPVRRKCDLNCRSSGYLIGFCIGPGFRTCNCMS